MKKGLIALGLVGAAAYFLLKGGGGQGLQVGGDSPPGTVLGGMSQPSQSGSSASTPNVVYNISFPEFSGFPSATKSSSGFPSDSGATKKTSAAWSYGTPDQPKPLQDPLSVASRGVTGNAIANFLTGGPATDLSYTAVPTTTKKETAVPVTFGGGGASARAEITTTPIQYQDAVRIATNTPYRIAPETTKKGNPTTVYGTTAPVKTTLGGGGIYEAFSGSSKLKIETKKMSTTTTVSGSSSRKGSGYSRYGLSTSSY